MLDAFIRIHLNSIVNQGISNVIADIGQTSRQLLTLLDTTYDGVITIDEDAVVSAFNPASERMFGINANLAVGSSLSNFFSKDILTTILDQADTFLRINRGCDSRPTRLKDVQATRTSGQEFAVEVNVFHTRIGDEVYSTLVVHDVTDRVQSIKDLQDTVVQYETLTKLAPVGILKLNREWTCEYANDLWCELSSLSTSDTLGSGWVDALHDDDRTQTLIDMHAALKSRETFNQVVRLTRNDEQPRYVSINATCLLDELNLQTGALVVVTDITDQHLAESRLKQLAHQDALTGLPNRKSFLRHLSRCVETRRPNNVVALLQIGLDGFKAINDTWGQTTGDELLQQVADRILVTVTEDDVVSRISGDHFSVVLSGHADVIDANQVAHNLVIALKEPFLLKVDEAFITASIGMSIITDTSAENEDDASTLIKQADVALHRAKASGRSRHVFFTPELDQSQKDKSALLTELSIDMISSCIISRKY